MRPELEARVQAACRSVLEAVAARELDFDCFVVAVRRSASDSEAAGFLKRGVGCALYEAWQELGRRVDFKRPEVIFELAPPDSAEEELRIELRAAYVYGRYRKLRRGVSQSKWVCQRCHGHGCEACGGLGRFYAQSVQELLSELVVPAFGSSVLASFHGMGREDVDVRMLGSGRPFVLEIFAPSARRRVDLAALELEIGRRQEGLVEVQGLRLVGREMPARVKGLSPDKSYLVRCCADSPVSRDRAAAMVVALAGVTLEQRTPERVSQRRADLVRRRRVEEVELLECGGHEFSLRVRAQSGTYIKELVSGDGGRTQPSVTGLLGAPCRCVELDVLDIHISDSVVCGEP